LDALDRTDHQDERNPGTVKDNYYWHLSVWPPLRNQSEWTVYVRLMILTGDLDEEDMPQRVFKVPQNRHAGTELHHVLGELSRMIEGGIPGKLLEPELPF
jgi:hypothetical protein